MLLQVKKRKMPAAGKCNRQALDKWIKDSNKAISLLTQVIPASAKHRKEMALLGSSALMLLQIKLQIGPYWGGEPNDHDVFVTGRWASTEAHFKGIVEFIMARMKKLGAKIDSVSEYHVYGRNQERFWVIDIDVKGIKGKISFVQAPGQKTVLDVLERFDINVCRVGYDFLSGELFYSETVRNDVARCVATVDGPAFGPDPVSEDDIRQVLRTMERVQKYTKRGFSFINMQGVRFVRVAPGTRKLHAKRRFA